MEQTFAEVFTSLKQRPPLQYAPLMLKVCVGGAVSVQVTWVSVRPLQLEVQLLSQLHELPVQLQTLPPEPPRTTEAAAS
ncbi:MAG TPA: hypothetical protein VJB18_04440 [Burkholderiales bacterium]|nr:hypothetical protein [Burkholderiales bacterium]